MQGRVVADDTGLPLPHAHVTVGGGARPTVLTDADGRFELPGTSPDRPVVSVSKVGYVTTRTAFTEGLAVRLPRSAVITGWVVDDHGSPLAGMAVVAEGRVPGERRLENEPRAMMVTDDLGAYRLFGLPAGDYVIGLAGLAVPSAGEPPTGGPPRRYYPDAVSADQAEVVTLRPGAEVSGIGDITASWPSRLGFRRVDGPRRVAIGRRRRDPRAGRGVRRPAVASHARPIVVRRPIVFPALHRLR